MRRSRTTIGSAPGLGREFAIEVSRAADRMLEYTHAWQRLDDEVPRCQLNRFPYGLVYSIEDDVIVVLAVMFLRREPNYWRDRLKIGE